MSMIAVLLKGDFYHFMQKGCIKQESLIGIKRLDRLAFP